MSGYANEGILSTGFNEGTGEKNRKMTKSVKDSK